MRARRQFAALASAAILALAGCGDDDEPEASETTEATALTEEQFLQEGNAICEAGNQEIEQAGQALGQDATGAELEAFVGDTLVPSIQAQIDALGELVPPDEIATDVDTLIGDAQAAVDELEADPSLVGQGPDPFEDVNRQAGDVGLTACAS